MRAQKKLDDSEPTPARQAELRAAYEKNVAAGQAPYAGVKIRTRGELSWVMREHNWSGELHSQGPADADLRSADLSYTNLSGVDLVMANLSNANLSFANLSRAQFNLGDLSGATFHGANLSRAHLGEARMMRADLSWANLDGADLTVNLEGANLCAAHMNADTDLTEAVLDVHTRLADVVWNGVPVTRLTWEKVVTLGDEWVAHQTIGTNGFWEGKPKPKDVRLHDFQDAVRANRQVATVLRSQGLNDDADRFAYRAQALQRQVLWRQRHPLRALFSLFLDHLAGYGYKPGRTVVIYVLAILSFGTAYYALGQTVGPHLSPLGAFVLSMTSFHGRGFFPGAIAVDDPLTVLAAFDALVGLVIEASFIATFTQRFFAR